MKNKGLKYKIGIGCIVFTIILTFAVVASGYYQYNKNMMQKYQDYSGTIVKIAESVLEENQMVALIETQSMNDSYDAIRKEFNMIKENSDIAYIFVVYFEDIQDPYSMCYAINGARQEELAAAESESEVYSYMGEVCGEADFDEAMRQEYLQSISEKEKDIIYYNNITKEYGHMMTCYKLLYNESDEPVGIISVDMDVNDIQDNMTSYVIRMILVALILMLVLLVVFVSYINRYVTEPITKIAQSTSDFVQFLDKNVSIEEIHYEKVKVSSKDEVGHLADDVAVMADSVKSYMKNLEAITAEKERIGAELNVATQIQADMLPNIFPAFPEHEEFDIHATMQPAKEVGGDFYDFFMVDEEHLAVVIADVSGKGVPAALFMVIAKTLIKNRAISKESPADIFIHVNDQLCENNETGMFVTSWLGIINIKTGHVDYVNAGHNHPIIVRSDGTAEWVKCRPGFVLAGLEGIPYQQNELQLNPGDMIYLYTDGVTEALNIEEELYGDARLMECLSVADIKEKCPQEVLAHVSKSLSEFVKNAEQADDITMLSLKIKKYAEEIPVVWEGEAKRETLDEILAILEPKFEEFGFSMAQTMQLAVAIEEIYVNIASYAYDKLPEGERTEEQKQKKAVIRCRLEEETKTMTMRFEDWGVPYNPLEKQDPDITLSAEERAIGGLGIYMVKQSMDDVSYKYEDGKNCLELIKKV